MPRLLDPTIHEAVGRDGLPRVADYDDGSRHVLYLDDGVVRSLTEAEWLAQRGALPSEPTQAEIDAALLAREQERAQALADAQALRQRVRTLAQSAVGVQFDQLTSAQLRALFAILLHKEGALDKTGAVRPLSEWVR